MREFVSYIRIAMLSALLAAVPLVSSAQSGAAAQHAIDSLENLISKDTSQSRLAILNYELARKYKAKNSYESSTAAAARAASYAKLCGDLSTQLSSCLLLGDNNTLMGNSEEAIKNYLQARKVIDNRAEELEKQVSQKQISKEEAESLRLGDVELDADIVKLMGLVFYNQGHYDRAITSLKDALGVYNGLGKDEKAFEVKKLLAPAYKYVDDYPNSLLYYKDLLDYYKRSNDWLNTKMNYQNIADILIKTNDYQQLEKYSKDLYQQCCQQGTFSEQLSSFNNYAYAMICQKKYDLPAQWLANIMRDDQDPDLYPQRGDSDKNLKSLLATSYTNLGVCYHNSGKVDEGCKALEKALKLRQEAGQYSEASSVANMLAHSYLLHDDIHNAEYYQSISMAEAETSKDREALKEAYKGLSEVYTKKGEFDEALKYYQNFLDLSEQDRMARENLLREKEEQLKKINEAEKTYQEAIVDEDIQLRRERELEHLRRMQDMLQDRNNILIEKRKADSIALAFSRANERKSDSIAQQYKLIIDLNKAKQIEDSIRKVETDSLNRIQKKLEDEALEQEKNAKEQRASMERFRKLSFLIGAVLLVFLVFLVVLRSKNVTLRKQQAQIEQANKELLMKNDEITAQKENLQVANNEISMKNEELLKQKDLIEQANKSITDSIVYAKRIQTAVSPSQDFLQDFHLEYFLFFRPRDIVSGDYYWFYSAGSSVFICAADCTGHGVPGAFMSMLGLSLFNKIVAERGIYEPDKILNNLRTEVKLALHQESINSSQKDGMDLSLVRYDMDTMMLHFAAANNNGYLIQHFGKDEEEQAKDGLAKPAHLRETADGFLKLTVMPSDSMPIGVYIRERESFTMTSYKLKHGDTFYLSSDGYVDQFGGRWGRKFLSKNFQRLLLDINQFDMSRQKQEVIDTHDSWRNGEYEQLDDIIVIGVRV